MFDKLKCCKKLGLKWQVRDKGVKMHPGTIGKRSVQSKRSFHENHHMSTGEGKRTGAPSYTYPGSHQGTGGLSQAAEIQNQAAYAAFHYRFPAAWPVSVL
jgi:hypothetical protein